MPQDNWTKAEWYPVRFRSLSRCWLPTRMYAVATPLHKRYPVNWIDRPIGAYQGVTVGIYRPFAFCCWFVTASSLWTGSSNYTCLFSCCARPSGSKN